MEVIAWIGLAQALFSGILTLSKEKRGTQDKLLTAWLFLLAIEFLTFGLESKIFPNFVLLTNSFLLLNPALYLYTRALTNSRFHLKWIQLLHLLPYLFFKITAWIIKEPQVFETFFQPDPNLWFRMLFGSFGIVSWVIYLALTGVMITRHRKQVRNEFSTLDTFRKIGWLLFIVIFYILYCLTVFLWGLFNIIFLDTLSLTIYNYSVLLVFIYIFGFYGLKQKELFSPGTDNNGKQIRTQVSFLNDKTKAKIQKKILEYFEKEQPYLNPDLSMGLLSEKLEIPKHHITEVLNGVLGKNFFQFVNEYRVEAVKKKLVQPKQPYSIEAIGYECGFNSKSTFFSVFKQITGQTPAEFKTRPEQV
ncbi:MAG TPA: helix-turn-helix domain-containing protein [Prolixibacteraceae bacterium]|nr:helix-turn-helix domain-containing protein [Prolixibacteraceae bacterium]